MRKFNSRQQQRQDICECCGQNTTDFSYHAGKSGTGRKLSICLCEYCNVLYSQCGKCRCMVRHLGQGGICEHCREQEPGEPIQDIDLRLDTIALRPMTWGEGSSSWGREIT